VLFGSFFISLAWIADFVEPGLLGTASGVMNMLGFFPAFVLPWLMGIIMDAVDRPTSPAWQYSQAAYDLAFWLTVASLAAVWRLHGEGVIGEQDTVVAVITATGLKDPEPTAREAGEIPVVPADLAALRDVLQHRYGFLLAI